MVKEPTLVFPGCLPYDVGCPTFTRKLLQVQWPHSQNFKPNLPEKYDGKLNPAEFLRIYTIAGKLLVAETTRFSPTIFHWHSSPT